jgi:hypothetical protein
MIWALVFHINLCQKAFLHNFSWLKELHGYMHFKVLIWVEFVLDVCKPFVTGQIQCLAYQRRYKYEPTTGDCTQHIYGGCGGNSNNFGSLDACRKKCAPEKLSPVTTESPIEGSGDPEITDGNLIPFFLHSLVKTELMHFYTH